MSEQQHAAPGRGAPDGPGTAAADPPGRAPDRFRRVREQKMIGGVCTGLGRHVDMDPVVFRIVLAVLSVAGGLGLIFYGFVWLFVPFEGEEENEARRMLTGRVDGPALAAVVFALVGCGAFLSMLHDTSLLTSGAVLALLLAGAGYWSRHRGAEDPDPLAAHAAADAPPETTAPPAPHSGGSWWRDPLVKDGAPGSTTGYLWAPEEALAPPAGAPGGGSAPGARAGAERSRCAPRPGGRQLGGTVTSLAVFAAVFGTATTWDSSALSVSLQTGLAAALAVFGLGIAVSSFLGRTGPGTVVLALLTAGLLTAATALPHSISTDWLRTTWTPASAAQVKPDYLVGTGVGTLDLRRAVPAPGRTVTSNVEVGAGRLRIIVPPQARVDLKVSVGLGDVQLPGDRKNDIDIAPDRFREVTLDPVGPVADPGTFKLTLDVGLGQAEVDRVAP
ncbi:PspC domain-containing protein [Streptomyces sp. LE64]|uniref:PspC domain-containing protein n=1 Tax=Streptomyces sp. LE64 TaxID=3448653 RepID=UPI00404117C5